VAWARSTFRPPGAWAFCSGFKEMRNVDFPPARSSFGFDPESISQASRRSTNIRLDNIIDGRPRSKVGRRRKKHSMIQFAFGPKASMISPEPSLGWHGFSFLNCVCTFAGDPIVPGNVVSLPACRTNIDVRFPLGNSGFLTRRSRAARTSTTRINRGLSGQPAKRNRERPSIAHGERLFRLGGFTRPPSEEPIEVLPCRRISHANTR